MTTNRVVSLQPVIVTSDQARLHAFYAAIFGAEETVRVPDEGTPFYVGLRVGASEIGIVADEKAASGAGRVILTVFVENVDDLLPEVERAGGTVYGPANDMPWGQRVAHVADPDGNALNLTQQL